MEGEKMKNKENQNSLPGYYIPAWSAQGVSYAIAFFVLGYLTYYCTYSLGMNPVVVGAILLVS